MKRKLFFGVLLAGILVLALGGLTVRGSRRVMRGLAWLVHPSRPRPSAPAYG